MTAEVKSKKTRTGGGNVRGTTHTRTTTNSNYKMKSNTAKQSKVPNKMMMVTVGGFPKKKRSASQVWYENKIVSIFQIYQILLFIADA